ncbi:helix-turn-helix transcriptional regulator [Flavobacterium sp. LB2P84]|uniref:helix-turn-helix domain-containing protein n=1 Tax=Flavobacterium yafengii TaxID=3041253 RepID=UPI0024A85CEC|nr:helix-turn-helix transcriptional regulator [Flavobacterium yafengii]MDI6034027.1 helix-turn-helix transcriptional regulator [Flavobacterium yafengii]
MYQSDMKIFELIELLKSLGIIRFDADFCRKIEMPKQSIPRIRQGKAHFTAEHISNICKVYNVNANWIFGIEKNIFNPSQVNTVKELA